MRVPLALRIQAYSNGDDEQLLAVARRAGPSRRWWWGVRRWCVDLSRGGGTPMDCDRFDDSRPRQRCGAWCYVCDRPIATWSGRWPVTETARLAVQEHRTAHIQGRLDTPPQEITA